MSVQPVVISPSDARPGSLERARQRFSGLVALGKQLVQATRSWALLGRLAADMERDRDYTVLGYETMGACILEVEILSGYDRSSIYSFKALYEQASPNAGESILEMPLGSAQIYKQLPAALQKDPEVKAAARFKPKLFRRQVADNYPEALIESRIRLSLNLDVSLYEKWESFLGDCRARNGPEITYEQAFEELLANVDTAD